MQAKDFRECFYNFLKEKGGMVKISEGRRGRHKMF